jgi:hypothetical protein
MAAPSTSWRGFVSLTLIVSGFIALITGLVLYIVPEGRVANWVIWDLFGLAKSQWQAIHTLSSFLFAIFAVLHLLNNWRSVLKYLFRAEGGLNQVPQLITAFVLAAVIILSAIFALPPLQWVMDLGAWAKGSWVTSPEFEPPFGHAEDLSLKAFCIRMDIPEEEALAALRQAGFSVADSREKLLNIAANNRTSPMKVYEAIKALELKPLMAKPQAAEPAAAPLLTAEEIEAKYAGMGIGRKTLSQVCEMIGMEPARAREILAARGIEIGPDETMKQVADRLEEVAEALDLVKILLQDAQ